MKRILLLAFMLIAVIANASPIVTIANIAHQKIQHPKQAMPDAEAKEILKTLQHKASDEEKVAALKAGVKDKGITVEQLTTLLNQFNLDENKLACAEFAYPFTVNYKQFFKIKDLFGEEETKHSLEAFLDHHN